MNQAEAARWVGLSPATVSGIMREIRGGKARDRSVPDPLRYVDLSPDAQRAFDNFDFFCERYLAREPVPWRQMMSSRLVSALDDRTTKTFITLAAPSGVGKTSLAEDLTLWCLVRNRGLRSLLGAEILDRAEDYLRFVMARLEATTLFFDHITKREATGVLAQDFGRLRPTEAAGDQVMWRRRSIIVAQLGGVDLSSKEPSVQIASRDSGFLGSRFDLMIFDDLLSLRNYRDAGLSSWWSREAETRLEPGGVLLLIGTRIGSEDLFEECENKTFEDDDGVVHRRYETITLPAHRDDLCTGEHRQWDGQGDGCLADEKRVGWSEIMAHRDDPHFGTTWQQDPSLDRSGLVPKVWIVGGRDENGESFESALEPDRAFSEYPNVPGLLTYATVDPALSTGMWAIEIWATTRQKDGHRYLLDAIRTQMRIDDFLRVDGSGGLVGVMMDLQREYQPRTWLIEGNFTKGFGGSVFESVSFKLHNIEVLWPRTGTNKTQGQASVEAVIPPLFRSGRVHLPFRDDASRAFVRQFMAELVAFPHGRTSDLVMSMWLGEASMRSVLAKGTQQGRVLPDVAHGGRYDPRYHQQGGTARDPDPDWHSNRGHPFSNCSGCGHAHWCVTCQGYPLCPTTCDCDRQGRFVGQTPQPAPRASRVTVGLGEYGRPNPIADLALGNVVHRIDLERRKP